MDDATALLRGNPGAANVPELVPTKTSLPLKVLGGVLPSRTSAKEKVGKAGPSGST